LKEAVNLDTRAANRQGGSDVFPSTHWSVVLAAGRSEAEPEMAGAALTELCQVYWAPLYGFVRSRGHAVHDAQDLTQSFSLTCSNIKFTPAWIDGKAGSVHFYSPP
jgi:hypothetical protein